MPASPSIAMPWLADSRFCLDWGIALLQVGQLMMLPPTPWLWREDVSNAGWGFAAARLGSGAREPAGLTPAQALTIIPENKVGAFSRQASAAGARCRERLLAIMQLILPERKVSILRNKLRASAIYTNMSCHRSGRGNEGSMLHWFLGGKLLQRL